MKKLHEALNVFAHTIEEFKHDFITGKKNIRLVYITYLYVNQYGELKRYHNYIVSTRFKDEFILKHGEIIL
jgi:hypothetical protein